MFDAAILTWVFGQKPKAWLDTLSMARAILGTQVGGSLGKLVEHFGLGAKGFEVNDAKGLRREGFAVLPAAGTYFLCIDLKGSGIGEGDRAFCLRAVKEAGVAAIPVSAFYETEPVTRIVRLCFSKGDDTLDEGVRRLARARELSRLAATAGK